MCARRDWACLLCERIHLSYSEEIVQKIETNSDEIMNFKQEIFDLPIFWDTRLTENCRTTHVLTNTLISSAHSLLRQSSIYYFSGIVNNDHLIEQNVCFKLL